MIITKLFEAGTPVITDHKFDRDSGTRTEMVDKLRALGAETALNEVLTNKSKLLFRGLRNVNANIIQQNTLASTRKSENTSNYVTWLTEVLPSWKRAGILPRSKIVSCTSNYTKARSYGVTYVVLPTDNSSCVYTGAHDFWDAFEGTNHVFGGTESVPAINDAFDRYATKLVTSAEGMIKMCQQLEADLESGRQKEEDLNNELQALLQSDDNSYDLMEILDNLLDPSHMRKSENGHLLVPGDYQNYGEEVQVGGNVVYVEFNTFMDIFMPMRDNR